MCTGSNSEHERAGPAPDLRAIALEQRHATFQAVGWGRWSRGSQPPDRRRCRAAGQAGGLPIKRPPRPLSEPPPQNEFDWIFSRVPRLTVEVVIASSERGVLALRERGPCQGLWPLPGGTVRFGEPITEAVRRVAWDELGLAVSAGALLGYIEYPATTTTGSIHPLDSRSARTPRSPRCPTSARRNPATHGSPPCPTTSTTNNKTSSPAISTASRPRRPRSHQTPA